MDNIKLEETLSKSVRSTITQVLHQKAILQKAKLDPAIVTLGIDLHEEFTRRNRLNIFYDQLNRRKKLCGLTVVVSNEQPRMIAVSPDYSWKGNS